MELFFLGCGGGRVVLDLQTFPTGGFRLHDGKVRMHVDPGPGALLNTLSSGLFAQDLNAVFASHCHLDHTGDLKVIIEAMTLRHRRRFGTLLGAKSVIEGDGELEKEVPEYFKSLLSESVVLSAGDYFEFLGSGSKLHATRTDHEDPGAVGFVYHSEAGLKVGYTSDTQAFEGLWSQFEGVDALIINCLRPGRDRLEYHLCVDDVVSGVESMSFKPKKAVLTHFGEKFAKAGIEKEVSRFEKRTGIPALAARNGLGLKVGD